MSRHSGNVVFIQGVRDLPNGIQHTKHDNYCIHEQNARASGHRKVAETNLKCRQCANIEGACVPAAYRSVYLFPVVFVQ